MKSFTLTFLIISVAYLLNGCTTAVIGGAVAGTSVALDNRTTGDYVEDQNIKSKFAYLYYQDDELSDQTHINVTSYNRQILITGEVLTEQQKQKLSDIASQIKNVRKYFNEVTIGKPSSMSTRTNDSYLTSKIKTSVFTNMKELDGAQVKVVTESGSVFLMGLVTPSQGNQITEIARTTRGVKRVIKLFEYPVPQDKRI
ncbi:MAG: BON domain-containing protein [gamma proteobacterium symbiont of Bathyaustriella thionipta]|nr:BON domain-containing protein [gamma proteobacterium symbiont of Bathyaustriella thionipta]MCU7948407.1 BON domain-containing protein [gamma proteobacterium symbiont of Bathyaustriella thionipta]MCU7954106.1 BON domain-containing protein [gamma proteobacterium symbiont of Bathyaustriella thionipta]MCU7955399.1 BON domain-containing protein [gamma proteobacterium symbiont of Bathyaustriella thionipta]MCU7966766.1 BON domain-containing protein [gamma proteobacterium symbiont of Bathyaustriella